MKKRYTYKQKWQFLLAGSLIFLLIVYLAAIQKTIALYQVNQDLKEQTASFSAGRTAEQQQRLGQLDAVLDAYTADSLKSQESLLEAVSTFCQQNGIRLKEFPQAVASEQNSARIETYKITAQGSFHKLVQLVYELEQQNRSGRVASATFELRTDVRTRSRNLFLILYLQNIRK